MLPPAVPQAPSTGLGGRSPARRPADSERARGGARGRGRGAWQGPTLRKASVTACFAPALRLQTLRQEGLERSRSKGGSCGVDWEVQRGEEGCPGPHSELRGCLLASGPGFAHTRRVAGLGLAAASRRLHAGPSGPALDCANPICSPRELSPGHQNPLLMSCGGQTPTGETPEPLCPSRPLSCREWLACAAAEDGQDRRGRGGARPCWCLPGPRHDLRPGHDLVPASMEPDPGTSGRRASRLDGGSRGQNLANSMTWACLSTSLTSGPS